MNSSVDGDEEHDGDDCDVDDDEDGDGDDDDVDSDDDDDYVDDGNVMVMIRVVLLHAVAYDDVWASMKMMCMNG